MHIIIIIIIILLCEQWFACYISTRGPRDQLPGMGVETTVPTLKRECVGTWIRLFGSNRVCILFFSSR